MRCFCRKFCIFFKYSSHVELSSFRFRQMFINAFIFHNIWTSLFWHFLIPVLSVFCIANLCKFKFTSVLHRHTDEIKKDSSQEATFRKPCQEPHAGAEPGTSFLSLNLPVLLLVAPGPAETRSEVLSALRPDPPVAAFSSRAWRSRSMPGARRVRSCGHPDVHPYANAQSCRRTLSLARLARTAPWGHGAPDPEGGAWAS